MNRIWNYYLYHPVDDDLERRVSRWAARRDFPISYSFPDIRHLQVQVQHEGVSLSVFERAYTGLRRIVGKWNLKRREPTND